MAAIDLTNARLLDRLRRARDDRGLSQQAVADELGIARTTLIAIEAGRRKLRADELIHLADLYDLRLEVLLRDEPAARPLAAQFRTAAGRMPEQHEMRVAAELLQELAEDYVVLERELSAPLPTNYPLARELDTRDVERQAIVLAEEERRRLGLGDGPVPHLRETLEDDVGLRIFAIRLPSRIGGLFAHDDELGACIAMNGDQRWERQRWSLAHEYAHFLTRQARAEITITLSSYQRVPPSERFADAFARNLLLPTAGLTRRWEASTAGQKATVATLLSQADRWGVSLQAFVLRLEGLKLLKPGTYDGLLLQGLAVDEARSLLGLPERQPDAAVVGRRMRLLAVTAYAEGQLSEERLSRILRVDRLTARQTASSLLTGLGREL